MARKNPSTDKEQELNELIATKQRKLKTDSFTWTETNLQTLQTNMPRTAVLTKHKK